MPPLPSSTVYICFSPCCYFIPSLAFRKILQTSDTWCPLKTKLNLGIQEDAGKTESKIILFAQLKMEKGFNSRITLQPQASSAASPALIMWGLDSLSPV